VRKEWHLIGCLDLGHSFRHSAGGVADHLRHHSRIARGAFELVDDVLGVELGMWSLVPFDDQGCKSFLRRAHVVGHNRHGVVEPHDLADAVHDLCGSIIHGLDPAAEHR
jgi:hypothetical protein